MRTILSFISGVAIVLASAFVLAACGDESSGESPSGVTVVAGTTQLSDLATQVAGDRAEVVSLLSPSTDPHEYEPKPSDAERMIDADLILQSGGDVDLWLDQLIESSGTDGVELTLLDEVETIEGDHEHSHAHEEGEHSHEEGEHAHEEGEHSHEEGKHSHEDEHSHEEGEHSHEEGEHAHEDEHAHEEEGGEHSHAEGEDPHWWQSPINAIAAVEAIRDELIALDPNGRSEYERNAEEYIRGLRELDAQIERCMEQVPAEDRKLVTSHHSLGYFADRYGIEVVGTTIPALSTQAQPSAGETAELVESIREEGVSTIFPEAGVSRELEEAIASQADAQVGAELWTDALGPEDSDGATYVDALRSNTENLVAAFSDGATTCEFG